MTYLWSPGYWSGIANFSNSVGGDSYYFNFSAQRNEAVKGKTFAQAMQGVEEAGF